jgi:hypothetical protein
MAVQTRGAESVAWISGVSAVLLTTFFLLTILLHLRARSRVGRGLELLCFAATLLTHEAGVMLGPVLLLLDWTVRPPEPGGSTSARARTLALDFAPHVCLTAVYLVVTYLVNRSNSVVTGSHYGAGWHVAANLALYLTLLYVGPPNLWSQLLAVAAVGCGLVFGRPLVRFGLAFMLLTLLPYCLFTWGLTGRYLYLPGVGLAVALAALVPDLAERSPVVRIVCAVVVVALAGRFAAFARRTARDHSARTRAYVAYVERTRAAHPTLERGALLTVPAPTRDQPAAGYIESLLRIAYDDPTLRVVLEGAPEPR